MATFVVTNVKNASALAQLMKRHDYYSARVTGKTNIVCECNEKPWGILAGYMTNSTQVVEVAESDSIKDVISRYG